MRRNGNQTKSKCRYRSGRTIIQVFVLVAGMVSAAGPALSEAVERGAKFTTSWGELQTMRINPSSGAPPSGVGTDPNSHRYRDRGGSFNFENERQRFERKEPDGTVLKLQF